MASALKMEVNLRLKPSDAIELPQILRFSNDGGNLGEIDYRYKYQMISEGQEFSSADFFETRNMIFERIGRKLDCECEFLRNDDTIRRRELEAFGVDFKGAEERDLHIF